jgi:serine-threonine kinase receptor-associated protein
MASIVSTFTPTAGSTSTPSAVSTSITTSTPTSTPTSNPTTSTTTTATATNSTTATVTTNTANKSAISATVCPGHNRPVVGVHYVHADNQLFLISAALDSKPMLRNGHTGDWIGTFAGHKGAVWTSKLNSDATKAATGSGDFTAKIWDAIDGNELCSLKHRHIVKCVNFSSDSTKLLTGARDKVLRIFDLRGNPTEETAPVMSYLHPEGVTQATWTNDTNLVVSGCDDGILRTFDLRNQQVVNEMKFDSGGVTDIEMSAEGNTLVVAAGKKVLFLNATNPSEMEIVKTHNCKLNVKSVSLHSDKKTFLTAGTDLWVHEYNYETLEEVDVKKGHHGPVHCVKYACDDSNSYASGAEDATLRIWTRNKIDDNKNSEGKTKQ